VRGPSPVFAIVVSFQVPSLAIPAIRVVRKEEDRRSYSLPSASGDHVPAHHSPNTFSVPRMRTPLGPSRTSWSLHRTASTSDILVVTRRHARPASVPINPLSVTRRLPFEMRIVQLRFTFEPKDLTSPCP
jgi:hypothetical protein